MRGAQLLAVHLCRASGAASGGELGQRGGGGGGRGGGGGDGRGGGARGIETRGPLVSDSSLCTFLCLTTISLAISLVLYISFVTDFYGRRVAADLSPTFGAGRQTGNG